MTSPEETMLGYSGNEEPLDNLANNIGGLTLNNEQMYSPLLPTQQHTPQSHSQLHSQAQSPVNGYPSIQPRSIQETAYPDYGSPIYYTPALGSPLALEPPFTPIPAPNQPHHNYAYGDATATAIQMTPSSSFDNFILNPQGIQHANGGNQETNTYRAGPGPGEDGMGTFSPTRDSFRPLPGETSPFFGFQSQDMRHFFGYQHQDFRSYWPTPEGVFMERENRRTHRPNHLQLSTDSNTRYPIGPRSAPYAPSEYLVSPISQSFPRSQAAGPLSPGVRRNWYGEPPMTSPGSNFHAQSPAHFGLHYSPALGNWNPYAHVGYPFRHRREDVTRRSAFLEDFRINKASKKWEITDIFGHIVEFSGDQHGSRFIQQKLESSSIEHRQQIFNEIMPNAYALMTDVFGNYVTQKMFEHGDQYQKAALGKEMEGKVLSLSLQTYGCRVVQKAIEHLLREQRDRLVAELDGHIVDCVKDNNANHVVQRIVVLGPPLFVVDSFIGHVEELSCHPYGCRVLQKTFECLSNEMKRHLLDELHSCGSRLIEDQFGNCRQKYASNVVEKALQNSVGQDREALIAGLLGKSPNERISLLLRDQFGNFPVQTAFACAHGDQRRILLDAILDVLPSIKTTPVGKRLEMRLAELNDSSPGNDVGYLGSSISTSTEMSRSGSSSTQVTSPEKEPRLLSVNLRPTSSAPAGGFGREQDRDPVSEAAKALHDLLH